VSATEHAPLAPSAASRWINCPGSIKAISEAPPELSSSYAEEGTLAHSVFAQCLLEGRHAASVVDDPEFIAPLQDALDHARRIIDGRPVLIEQRLPPMPGIPDLWGTVDVAIFDPDLRLSDVIDLKFGANILVEADTVQTGIYGLLGVRRFGLSAAGLTTWIIQPRCFHPHGSVRSHHYDVPALRALLETVHAATAATQARWTLLAMQAHGAASVRPQSPVPSDVPSASRSCLFGAGRMGCSMRRRTGMRLRSDLHRYQEEGVEFFLAACERQLVAPMGAGKTIIALTAITDLRASTTLTQPILILAPLMIAASVWNTEVAAWEHTAHLRVVRVIGTAKQRLAALESRADIYVCNFDNSAWLAAEIARRGLHFGLLLVDEASALKNPRAQRTRTAIALGVGIERRWAITGKPRAYQLLDVWGPAQFCTNSKAFSPFYPWRGANFFTTDPYQRIWQPRFGVDDAVIDTLRTFTKVVDRSALATRPPVVEIVHDIEFDPISAGIYAELDAGGVTDSIAANLAQGLRPGSELAIVGKLMQVCSGAVYDDEGVWRRLHDLRLDMLEEIHAAHRRPTLVFFNFRHEAERIRQRFPFAVELHAGLIDSWNAGRIEMLLAHPASAGHGVNLQYGSDTLVWFSLPWSAELFQQANARLARQGQPHTVNIHILISSGRIDEIALRVVRNRLRAQDELIEALRDDAA
jgi:hypothetical protein